MPVYAKDIAKALGISTSTVSMALNGKGGISAGTTKQVLEKAREMGYHRMERTPFTGKNLQYVIYKKHGFVVGDTPFFSALLEGVEMQATHDGYGLQINYFYESQDIERQLQSLIGANTVGLVLLATEMTEEDVAPFLNIGKPIVVLDCACNSLAVNCIAINNVQTAYTGTKYLLQAGHRQIGYLASSVPINNFREREAGFRRAIEEFAPQDQGKNLILRIRPTIEEAYTDIIAHLKHLDHLPTAFFADNDIIATSGMRALKEYGYRLPEDISIVGIDDIPTCEVVQPRLTTMRVDKRQMGKLAIKRLIELLNDDEQEDSAVLRIELSSRLIERESTRILPTQNS